LNNLSQSLISIIFPVKNEGENVKTTLDSLFNKKTNNKFEVIIVDDASEDGCCGFLDSYGRENITLITTSGVGAANARNVGAEASRGEYLIFCDAHLFFEDYWIDGLISPITQGLADAVTPGIGRTDNPNIVGYGQTLNPENFRAKWNNKKNGLFETAILPGGCFAISRKVFFDVNGFERGFRVWGFEDIELSIKLWLFGYRCFVQPEVKILHLFRTTFPYKVTVDYSDYNMMRMAYSHFSLERVEKCKKLIRRKEYSEELIESLLSTDILKQRDDYFNKRVHDDEWFFKKFDINF